MFLFPHIIPFCKLNPYLHLWHRLLFPVNPAVMHVFCSNFMCFVTAFYNLNMSHDRHNDSEDSSKQHKIVKCKLNFISVKPNFGKSRLAPSSYQSSPIDYYWDWVWSELPLEGDNHLEFVLSEEVPSREVRIGPTGHIEFLELEVDVLNVIMSLQGTPSPD